MFADLKAYAAGIGVVVVLAILGAAAYSYHSSQEEAKKDAGTIAVQGEVISSQQDTLETQQKASQITADVLDHHQAGDKKTEQDFDAIARREQAEIAAIHNQPHTTPVAGDPLQPTVLPPAGVTPEEAQVSFVRINALWSSYCVARPTAEECKS